MLTTFTSRFLAFICTMVLGALALAGCNGSGGGSGTTVPTSAPGTVSQLYVSGNTTPRLLVYNDANTVSGSTLPNRVVAGGSASLSGPRGIAVDMARDQAYVANYANNTILVFNGARKVTGGDAPARTISKSGTLIGPTALFVDPINDKLYVANTSDNSILIYDAVSKLGGNNITPDRILKGNLTDLNAPTGIYVDITRNLLYVANSSNEVFVFNNAVIAQGNNNFAPLSRIPISSKFAGIFVDVMADRLYVTNTSSNTIHIFDTASAADSNSTPDRILSGGASLLNNPRDVFVDASTDRLYVANSGSNSILVFDNASTVANPAAPIRNLTLTASTGPWGIYVDVTPIVIGSIRARDGYILNNGSSVNTDPVGGGPKTGDMEDGFLGPRLVARQFYSFELTGIPSTVNVHSATLRLYQANAEGSPYGISFLGNVIVDHMDYGTSLVATDYNKVALTPNIGTLSTNMLQEYKTLNVTASVTNDILSLRLRSQYRLRFSQENSINFLNDYAQFTDAEDPCCTANYPPQLVITIRP